MNNKAYSVFMLLATCFAFYTPDASAHLDPATGTHLFHLILGTAFGLAILLSRLMIREIKYFFPENKQLAAFQESSQHFN
jgi:hypothetical protein